MYMFANMNLQSGQYKEAGALYEKALQLAGDKPWDNASGAYFGLAKSYKGIGMDDKAKEMFRESIKRDTNVIDRMITSGETQYGDEEYEEALETYGTALGLAPHKDSEIYYNIGLVYQKLKDADKELEAFEKSVALKPNYTDALQHLAEVLFYRIKDATRAELYDKEAKGQGSTDYRIQKELGDLCYRYGDEFSKVADYAKQSSSCYSWAKIKYGNAVRIVNRKITGELKNAVEAGDESEAKQIVEDPAKVTLKLVSEAAASGNQLASGALQDIAPLLADYRFTSSRVAVAQIRSKQLVQAQKQLEKVSNDDPNASDSADFHYALGELALAQGDRDAGIAEIRKALEIDPEHKEAADKLKEIETQGTS
jgi:tetratricopeptide (TPR) repeat protein